MASSTSPSERMASTFVDFIEAGATVPEDFMLTLIDWARRHSAIDLLMVVAASKLSPRADALIQAIPDAKVVVAWLTAPHRSPEEVSDVIRRETRKTILAAAVSSGALSDAQTAEVITRGGQLSVRTVLARDYLTSPDDPNPPVRGPLTGAALCRYIGEHMMQGSVIDSSPNIPVIGARAVSALVSEFPSEAAAVHSYEWTAWLARESSEVDPDVALIVWRQILNKLTTESFSEYKKAHRFEMGCARIPILAQWCAPLLTTDDLKDLEDLLRIGAISPHRQHAVLTLEAVARVNGMLNAADIDGSELWDVLQSEASYSPSPTQVSNRSRWMTLSKAEIAAFAEEQMADQAWFDRYMGAQFALRLIGRMRTVSETAALVLARKFKAGDPLGASVWMQHRFLSSPPHMAMVREQFEAEGLDWPSALNEMLSVILESDHGHQSWKGEPLLALLNAGARPDLVVQMVGSGTDLGRRLRYHAGRPVNELVAAAGTSLFGLLGDLLATSNDLDAVSQMAEGQRTLVSLANAFAAINGKTRPARSVPDVPEDSVCEDSVCEDSVCDDTDVTLDSPVTSSDEAASNEAASNEAASNEAASEETATADGQLLLLLNT